MSLYVKYQNILIKTTFLSQDILRYVLSYSNKLIGCVIEKSKVANELCQSEKGWLTGWQRLAKPLSQRFFYLIHLIVLISNVKIEFLRKCLSFHEDQND